MRHMPRPGDRLRAIAARVCNAKTMERLIDPVVADLQTEYVEANRHGRLWKSRWVRVAGYTAFLKVIAFAACEGSRRGFDVRIAGDHATGRMTGWAVSVTVILTALLEIPALSHLPPPTWHVSYADRAKLLLYLVPQALPIAVPIAFTLAILRGWTGRTTSPRSSGAILAIGFACSLAMFAMLAWIVPTSNQAFRVTVAGHDLAKGLHELTLGDLSRQVALELPPFEGHSSIRQLATEYHVRWALACTTFVFALFSLAVIPRRPAGRTIGGLAACGIYFAYYITVFDGTEPLRARVGSLPPFAIAWLPNVVMIVASAALITVRLKADTTYERGREG
jgi:lipopolysaccharide export system permease LptF/LptG-like protein